MCFTPLASIATAATEFSITGYLLKTIKNPKLLPVPVFVFLLGFYQFTEFMLCMNENIIFWARLGFAIYTLLPIVLCHMLMNFAGKRFWKSIYIFPILFSGLAFFHPNFIIESGCNLLHVSVHSIIFNQNNYLMFLYLLFYFIPPLIGFIAFTKSIRNKVKKETMTIWNKIVVVLMPITLLLGQIFSVLSAIKNINPNVVWVVISIFIVLIAIILIAIGSIPFAKKTSSFVWILQCILSSSIVTLFILYGIFPQFAYNFASIFCQFALLYALVAILLVKHFNIEK